MSPLQSLIIEAPGGVMVTVIGVEFESLRILNNNTAPCVSFLSFTPSNGALTANTLPLWTTLAPKFPFLFPSGEVLWYLCRSSFAVTFGLLYWGDFVSRR